VDLVVGRAFALLSKREISTHVVFAQKLGPASRVKKDKPESSRFDLKSWRKRGDDIAIIMKANIKDARKTTDGGSGWTAPRTHPDRIRREITMILDLNQSKIKKLIESRILERDEGNRPDAAIFGSPCLFAPFRGWRHGRVSVSDQAVFAVQRGAMPRLGDVTCRLQDKGGNRLRMLYERKMASARWSITRSLHIEDSPLHLTKTAVGTSTLPLIAFEYGQMA
jgi:hypothetical protein